MTPHNLYPSFPYKAHYHVNHFLCYFYFAIQREESAMEGSEIEDVL